MKATHKQSIGIIGVLLFTFLWSPGILSSQDEVEVIYNITEGELPSWANNAGKFFVEGGNRIFICEAKTHNLHNSMLLARLRFKRMLVEYISLGVINQASSQFGENAKNLIATRSKEEINFVSDQIWYLRKIKFNNVVCFQAFLKTTINEQMLQSYVKDYVKNLK